MAVAPSLLITGADGFLGSRLAAFLGVRRRVVGLGRRDLDITDAEAVRRTLERLRPEVVVHAAAVSDTGACARDPEGTARVNVEGPRNLAVACAVLGARLVHLSSDQVFNGNLEPGPYGEGHEPRPDTAYGRQKRDSEQVVLDLAPQAVVLRLTWLFDFPQRGLRTNPNLVWNVLRAALTCRPLSLPSREFRGLTYVQDLVERFESFLALPGGIYHPGGANDRSTYEAGALVLRMLGLASRIPELLVADEARFAERPRDLRIGSDRLSLPSAEAGIRRCVRDHFGGTGL